MFTTPTTTANHHLDIAAAAPALPPDVAARLTAILSRAIAGGLAPATIRALRSDAAIFIAFCADRAPQAIWLPAVPATVAAFIDACVANHRAAATISRYLSSISALHDMAGLPNPCADAEVRLARRGARRELGTRQRQAAALNWTQIERIAANLAQDALDSEPLYALRALRDRALILTAYDTMARVSELAAFRREDIQIDPDLGEGLILKRRSKTDQEGRGRKKWLSRATVEALLAWFEAEARLLAAKETAEPERYARQAARLDKLRRFRTDRRGRLRKNPLLPRVLPEAAAYAWEATPFLFRALVPHKEPDGRTLGWASTLSPQSIAQIFAERAAEAGISTAGISGHSARVGQAQDLLAAGEDLLGVMESGDWKSATMPLRYGEDILAGRTAAARQGRKRTGRE